MREQNPDRQTDRQTDRDTYRQTDRQTDGAKILYRLHVGPNVQCLVYLFKCVSTPRFHCFLEY